MAFYVEAILCCLSHRLSVVSKFKFAIKWSHLIKKQLPRWAKNVHVYFARRLLIGQTVTAAQIWPFWPNFYKSVA